MYFQPGPLGLVSKVSGGFNNRDLPSTWCRRVGAGSYQQQQQPLFWGPTTQKGLCWFFVRSSLALDGNIVGSDRKVSFKLSVSMYIQTCVDYVQF